MKNARSTAWLPAAVFSCFLVWLPGTALAGSYLATAFVPELGTPTFELQYSTQATELKKYELDKTYLGARLSYVPYPAVEGFFDLRLVSCDLEGGRESGLGIGGGLKYQFARISRGLDVAAAVQASYGSAENFSEYDLTALVLLSRDSPQGWTPFGGLGAAWGRAEFDGRGALGPARESGLEPAAFFGLKYLFRNALGGAADVFIRDGVGLEVSLSYRY